MKSNPIFFILFLNYFIKNSLSLTCALGTFYFELTDKCENCSIGCNTCTGFHESQCSACKTGFNKIQIDNQFYCTQCTKGQYYDTTKAACVSCGIDCDMCFSAGTCLICKIGYVYDKAYKACDSKLCDYGYYRNYVTNACVTCPPTQLQCTSSPSYDTSVTPAKIVGTSITALQCQPTLQLYNGSCSCIYATYLTSNVCKPCKDVNCASCSSTSCSVCKDGYYNQVGTCVKVCDQKLYYVSWSTPYTYYCDLFSNTFLKITLIKNQYYCNEYLGYESNYGCFTLCRPHEFKLYDTATNSYICVTQCPKNSTLDSQYMTCIRKECSNDITYQQGGTCFYRTCTLGKSFQDFISHTQKSICQTNYQSCINQQEESSNCVQCNPGYLNSYSSGTCVLTCTNTNYYFSRNYCSTCSISFYTAAQIQTCLSNNRQLTYIYSGTTQYGSSCPEGYTTSGSVCNRCPNTSLINCDTTKIQYVCEWGTNNQVITCDAHDLTSLATSNKGFDAQGSLISLTDSSCKTKNADGTCKVCGSSYNYNFKGICSKRFARATKYYFYYNNTDTQYQIFDSCLSNQYVSREGSAGIRMCKDFAYCSNYVTQTINGIQQNLCTSCPQYFVNLNGNCIEKCPNYTFKNITTMMCTTPIDNCAIYDSSTIAPKCSTCRQSYVRYINATLCIPISTCINGLYFNLTQNYCLTCPVGCSVCESTNICLTPATGYILQNNIAVQTCSDGYFKPAIGNVCQKCSQFCLTCTNATTCTSTYKGLSYYYLLTRKVYYYVQPICKSNEYYDSTLNQCILCDPQCSQCILKSTQCTQCADSSLALLNSACVKPCPDGYYQSNWITANYNRLICKKCDAQCSTCTNQSSYCLTCSVGYSFYRNQCLKTCPTNYISKQQKCMLKCPQYQFNPDPDSCQPCLPECQECQNSNSCTLCKSPQYVQNGSCVDSCIDPFFLNQEMTACIQCVNACKTCEVFGSTSKCTECKDGYVIDTNNNDCLNCDISCSTCFNNPTSCFLCKDETQFLLNNTCVSSCGIGYYSVTESTADYTRQVCKACDVSCLNINCQTDSKTCVEGCSPGYYGYQGQCLSQCPNGYEIINQLCYLICQQGFYSLDQYTCAPCKPECLECTSGKECIKCQDTLFYLDGQCLQQCTLPYFEDLSAYQCMLCGSEQCKQCNIVDSVATCILCDQGYILDDKNICTPCKSNEYSDSVQNLCLPCDQSCNQCFDASTNCKFCSNTNQLILNNHCLDVCPSGYYKTEDMLDGISRNICKQCDKGCLNSICSNEATYCVSGCSEGLYFYQNRCLKECPTGYDVREQKCYKICQSNEYNLDQDTCSPCLLDCSTCVNGTSCRTCKDPLILQDKLCVKSCLIPYFYNEPENECINCRSKACTQCNFDEGLATCVKCKDGYALDDQNKCLQQEIDEKPKTKEEVEESKYENLPINYNGKIYEGDDCHYSCKQCKGPGIDDCLSCYLATRVFFESKYCLCADGYQEDGNQRCSPQSTDLVKVGQYMDLVVDFLILIAVACDRIPVLTLLLTDIISIGSYQIYIEQIYNYAGKLPIMQALYQSNFSKMIYNFLLKKVDVGVYKSKMIVSGDIEDDIELPLIFNDISTTYILNSLPYLSILAVSILILIFLKFKNQQKYETFLNRYLVIFYYLTFQDQILFIGLQLKYFLMESPLNIVSIVFLGVSAIFNIFMITRVIMLEKMSFSIQYSTSQKFKLLYMEKSYFFGLLAKLGNALSVIFAPQSIHIYVFAAILSSTLILQIFLSIKSFKIQSKLFFIGRTLITLQVLIFSISILFNESHLASNFASNNNLHSIQNSLNLLLLFEKFGVFSLELLILILKQHFYNYKAGLSTYTAQKTQQDSLITHNLEITNFNFELESYNQVQKFNLFQKE